MERGVVVGGMLISISFLLAVMLNRSAVDALPGQGVDAEVRGLITRSAPVAESSAPARSQVDVSGMTRKSSKDTGAEIRHADCPAKDAKDAEYAATLQKSSGNCPSEDAGAAHH